MLIKISQKTTYEHNYKQIQSKVDSYTGYWNAYINKMASLVVQSLSWGDQLNSEWFLMDGR